MRNCFWHWNTGRPIVHTEPMRNNDSLLSGRIGKAIRQRCLSGRRLWSQQSFTGCHKKKTPAIPGSCHQPLIFCSCRVDLGAVSGGGLGLSICVALRLASRTVTAMPLASYLSTMWRWTMTERSKPIPAAVPTLSLVWKERLYMRAVLTLLKCCLVRPLLKRGRIDIIKTPILCFRR